MSSAPTCLAAFTVASALLAATPAHGQDSKNKSPAPRQLHEPVRLTAGASNQWMGVFDPASGALYFVSDQNSTAEIFVQKPIDSAPRLLFESNADVSWPRPSADGKQLAYISYQADATGDVCVRDLASRNSRCLTGLRTAEMQPLWIDNGKNLATLTRAGLHSNYQLRRFVGNASNSELIVQRNMLGVAVSPDSRWLAYVPIERTRQEVGVSFANRSGQGLMLQRLGGVGGAKVSKAKPVMFTPDLPGLIGFPVFSTDGRYLYFAQYLNDTNGDGDINGNDNSVLFRVPFDPAAANPVASAWPEQLTSAQWNCRYPAPSPDRLIATCSHRGSLDIYSLPLAGAVPVEWNAARIRGELHVARNHWTKLLMLVRLLSLVESAAERIDILRHMVWHHVELREYRSALYHSEQVLRLAGKSRPGDAAWAGIMLELIQHRRDDVKLTHGQLSEQYINNSKQRATRLVPLADSTGSGKQAVNVRTLASLVLSEVQDDIGDKAAGLQTFARVDAKKVSDALTLEVYAQRARAIYALRGDRKALLAVYHDLAEHPALDTLERLRFAENFVAELLRGVAKKQHAALIDTWVDKVQPDSEIALMVQVARWLIQLDNDSQEQVRGGIFELYKDNRDPDRRRALVLATVRTASRLGNEYLQYQFSKSWTSGIRRSEPERKYAEALYRQIVLERSYTELAKGEVAEARASFYAATVQGTSLEGHMGLIEARAREGHDDMEAMYAKRYAKNPEDPEYVFVKAYLIARRLPAMQDGGKLDKAVERAQAYLERAAKTWPRSMEVHHVWGTILHQRALRKGSKDDALAAHRHFLLALDLARANFRFRAALHQQLGLLQASLGNHRLALKHFVERERLPHVRPEGELNLRMATARSYFHISRHADAVKQARRALELVDANPKLARYRPLVVDRLALYLQAAGEHKQALQRYRELIPIVDGADSSDIGAPINRIKVRLGVAASALSAGQFTLAVQQIGELESLVSSAGRLRPDRPEFGIVRDNTALFGPRDYRILFAGMRAQAHRGMNNFPAAMKAMERRRELLASRFEQANTDEDLLELARVHYHLAEYSFKRGAGQKARQHVERGLAYSRDYNTRTGSGVNEVGLRLLQAYAELHIYGGIDLQTYALDLKEQLAVAYEFICKHPSPNWAADRFLFELYLTMLEVST
ncbi:MAG: hypothetical protein MJE77_36405 [Proteobacteria bacterium]|nr:hypothetical protein [Pseudomonadota bacterium]